MRCGPSCRLLLWAVFVISSAYCNAVASQSDITEADFTRIFADSLKARLPGARVEILEDLHLAVLINDSTRHQTFLHNHFAEYRLDPSCLSRLLSVCVFTMKDQFKHTMDLDALMPLVRNCAFLEQTSSAGQPTPYHDTINGDLCLFYVIDDSLTMTFVSQDSAQPYDSMCDLRLIALDNLERILPEIRMHQFERCLVLTAGGYYEASLLLLDKLWSPETLPVKQDYVVGVPNRDLLLVVSSQDSVAIRELRGHVSRFYTEFGYPVSAKLFIRRGETWEIYEE